MPPCPVIRNSLERVHLYKCVGLIVSKQISRPDDPIFSISFSYISYFPDSGPLAVPGLSFGGPRSSTEGSRRRGSRRHRGGVWRGCPPPNGGGVWGEGYAPSPEIFFDFLPRNGAFCVHSDT